MKNNNAIIGIVLVAILLGGFFVFNISQNQTRSVEDTMMGDEDFMMEEDGMMVDGGEAMGDDMMVEDSMMDDENTKVFEIAGGAFYFTPEEMVVNEGDTVKVIFTNEGGTHDWNLDEFDVHTDIISTDESIEVTFVADAAGVYEYYCSVANHRVEGMVGTLTVLAAE